MNLSVRRMRNHIIPLFVGVLIASSALAFDVPPNDGFVTDIAGVLTPAQESQLESELQAYRQETTNEIAILIVESLEGESIADGAVDVGREWGIGTKENDNGILILVAYADRKLFIATGYGLEGAVPDIVAKGIIDEEIVPKFRSGEYYEGIAAGVDALKKHIGGEYTAERYSKPQGDSIPWAWAFLIGFVLLQWLLAILGRTKSWWLGGVIGAVFGIILMLFFAWWLSIPILAALGLLLDYIVSSNYKKRGRTAWWAGGGGWGSGRGGGSFGGFGGGSFGGGGAGGSW